MRQAHSCETSARCHLLAYSERPTALLRSCPQRTYLRYRDGANFLPAAVWHGPQSAQLRPTAAIAREVNLQAAARDYYAVSAVAAVLSDLLMLGGLKFAHRCGGRRWLQPTPWDLDRTGYRTRQGSTSKRQQRRRSE